MGYGTHHLADVATHCTHTHTHQFENCLVDRSRRVGPVWSVRRRASFFPLSFLLLLLFLSFSFVLKGSDIYIYIYSVFFSLFSSKGRYIQGKIKGTVFFFFFFSIPTAHQFIKVSPHPACAHTHTTHAPVCFQLMPRPSRFHNHLSFSFFLSWFFILCGENHTRRLSVSINRLFSIRKSKIEREKGKQVYNDRNQWRRATFFFMIRRAADWLTGLFWNCFTTRMYNVGGKVKF